MMLLYCLTNRLLEALNPVHIFGSIRRAGGDYWRAAAVWCLAELLRCLIAVLLGSIPVLGAVVSMAAWLYFMLVGGRAIGLVFQAKREQLGWFQ